MKVLALLPDGVYKPSGGVGEQFRELYNHLKEDVEYYICSYPEKNNLPNYNPVLNPVPACPHASLNTIMGQTMYYHMALQFRTEFDVIHAFDWSTFYAGCLCSWHFKKPLICTMQLSLKLLNKEAGITYCGDINTIDGHWINQLQVFFEEMGLYYSNKVIHVSDYYAKLMPQNNSTIIHNGINLDIWKSEKFYDLPGKNKLKFCYIGRASPMKGLQTILDCDIPDDVDFYFVISPINAEEPWLTKIKEKSNNQNIFFINGLYGQDKIDFLFSMDGVVMPSIHEPFGIVALEALISENLFLTTAAGGIKEIVEGVEYFFIDSPSSLRSAIKKIQKMPPEEKQKIIQQGVNRARQFSWKTQSQKLLKVYKDVINEPYKENFILEEYYKQFYPNRLTT
jgi:glycosyltransferase involved in cell wall biosynthesis